MNKSVITPGLGPLIVDIKGTELEKDDLDVLNHPLIGGVILFARNYQSKVQVTRLISEIKAIRSPQLLVCVDQEGGRVQRFKDDFTALPPLHTLGQLFDKDREQALQASRLLARLMAFELKPTGIDFSFAPVVDVYDPASQIIANRAFHHCPQAITALAKAYIDGLHDIGMIAVAKHFPGHGGVLEDSHLCLPTDSRCFNEVEKKDIIPYQTLMSHGLDGLMSAHVLFNHIDHLPSGFSRFWISDILRNKLGFKGIVFTDDLSMQGATEFGNIIDRTRLALEAGCDIALICNDRIAVEKVLDETSLQALINQDTNLSNVCRRQPQQPHWTPDTQEITSLLKRLETVSN